MRIKITRLSRTPAKVFELSFHDACQNRFQFSKSYLVSRSTKVTFHSRHEGPLRRARKFPKKSLPFEQSSERNFPIFPPLTLIFVLILLTRFLILAFRTFHFSSSSRYITDWFPLESFTFLPYVSSRMDSTNLSKLVSRRLRISSRSRHHEHMSQNTLIYDQIIKTFVTIFRQ